MKKVEKSGFTWRGREITRLEQFSDAVFAFALALFGPPWMTPIAGLIYFFIGPVMWWHWGRFSKRWQDPA